MLPHKAGQRKVQPLDIANDTDVLSTALKSRGLRCEPIGAGTDGVETEFALSIGGCNGGIGRPSLQPDSRSHHDAPLWVEYPANDLRGATSGRRREQQHHDLAH